MGKLDVLRRIIREEVAAVIKKELPIIIKEHMSTNLSANPFRKPIVESKDVVPSTLNTKVRKPVVPNFGTGNIMSSLLNETANQMMNEVQMHDGNAYMGDIDEFNTMPFNKEPAVVSDVTSMIQSAHPSLDVSMVNISAVPDFNQLMDKLIDKGAI